MATQRECAWCGEIFTPRHGNDSYCSPDHNYQAKKERQKSKRDPIKDFIPILMTNHEIIDRIHQSGKTEINREELEAYKIDISLCRFLKMTSDKTERLMLDFGRYYLTTTADFLTFKIYKHATTSTI